MKTGYRLLLDVSLVGIGYAVGVATMTPNTLLAMAATGVSCLLLGGVLVSVASAARGVREWEPFQRRLDELSHLARTEAARADVLARKLAEAQADAPSPEQEGE